jgi:chromosome segregation ATPase
MSTKESMIKETETLLEKVQREVLRELNSEESFLRKFFLGSSKAEYLRQLQSNISKAINKIKAFDSEDGEKLTALQTHLNEKTQIIRELEKKLEVLKGESESLRDKIKTLDHQGNNREEPDQKFSQDSPQTVLEEKYKQKIAELEESYGSVLEKLKFEQEEASQAKNLSLELSRRLKRLKTEIISS